VVERVVADIAAEVRDILVFHLGAEEGRLMDDARLAEDLGADRLDLVEIAMSCEERFDIDIPNHVATRLATVGDAVRFIQARVAGPMDATTGAGPARPRLELLFGGALHACARLARRQGAVRDVFERTSSTLPSGSRVVSRGVAMRIILMLAVAGLVTLVLQPAGAAAETGYAAFATDVVVP
jgi:acyl carrier protein